MSAAMSLVWVPPVYPKTRFYHVTIPNFGTRREDLQPGWAREVFAAMRQSNFEETRTEKNRRRRRRQGRK